MAQVIFSDYDGFLKIMLFCWCAHAHYGSVGLVPTICVMFCVSY